MRGHLQQVRGQLVARCRQTGRADRLIGWFLALAGTIVYLLTLEPTTSFWDCGEFIAVSYRLQVGHPPGAPFYQLLAHLFTLMAGDNPLAVAWCSNALSAVAGGLTVMFLYWSIRLLQRFRHTVHTPHHTSSRIAAVVGSLCYLFCDTAWFSAVESEVYSLAMLIASAILWAMLRWYHDPDRTHASRWLMLIALLLGLGACTHLLTLLTLPALLLLLIFKIKKDKPETKKLPPISIFNFQFSILLLLFFLIGLTPYLIIPIRAAAGTPINEGHPATAAEFKSYIQRDQYEKAPLYPRMWRHREHDAQYSASWSGGDTTLWGNLCYYGSYQLTYMYLRYLMWNFSGRYNDRQGYGSLQNGQFLTGLPPVDRLLVGTAAPIPSSLPTRGHNIYYMLPLILGLIGAVALTRRRKAFWTVLTLFLMGGIILNIYLNHPCYEPRERDYAYILSFFAFCIFIAFGAEWIIEKGEKWKLQSRVSNQMNRRRKASPFTFHFSPFNLLLLAVPLLMAIQNWDDHDRSRRYIARDTAANMLNSCDSNHHGAILFTYGDNDTFPLWYLQTVEQQRTDIRVENINLIGWRNFCNLLSESLDLGRPVYLSHYAYDHYRQHFDGLLQLEGTTYCLATQPCDSVAIEPFYRHVTSQMAWHPLDGVYIDERCCKFLEQYWTDVAILAENLCAHGLTAQADTVLNKTLAEIPLTALQDPQLIHRIGQAFHLAGCEHQATEIAQYLHHILREQLDYYHTLTPRLQATMPYTVGVREELYSAVCE